MWQRVIWRATGTDMWTWHVWTGFLRLNTVELPENFRWTPCWSPFYGRSKIFLKIALITGMPSVCVCISPCCRARSSGVLSVSCCRCNTHRGFSIGQWVYGVSVLLPVSKNSAQMRSSLFCLFVKFSPVSTFFLSSSIFYFPTLLVLVEKADLRMRLLVTDKIITRNCLLSHLESNHTGVCCATTCTSRRHREMWR